MNKALFRIVVAATALALAAAARAEIQLIDGPAARIQVAPPPAGPGTVPAPVPPAGGPVTGTADGADPLDVLEFVNRDQLHGRLVSLVPEAHGLTWSHESVDTPIRFDLTGLARITLAGGRLAPPPRPATIRLTNDDILAGKLLSLDTNAVVLDTWYAGKVRIPRPMIRALKPNATSSLVYEGPVDLSTWTVGSRGNAPGWKLMDQALYAVHQSTVGRLIEGLPDQANIEFRAAWRADYPQFSLAIYTDELKQIYGDCYVLQVSSTSVYLHRYSRRGGSQNMGNISLQRLNQPPRHARFNVLADKANKRIVLLIDGTVVKEWTDPLAFGGSGKGILFQAQQQGALKISDIKISAWDGEIPDPPSEDKDREQDLIRLANNDKVSGRLLSIADGQLAFETSYATLNIPLERVLAVDMATESAEQARRNRADVRAHFVTAGTITVDLVSLKDGKLRGASENFGDIELPLDAFRQLDLNIYRDEDAADEFDLLDLDDMTD